MSALPGSDHDVRLHLSTASPRRGQVSRPAPPSGATPPFEQHLPDGTAIDLRPLAREICARYGAEFPDEHERYGDAGIQWCLHDNLYLLAWAFQDARDGTVRLDEQAAWLARVLAARDFPIPRLIRDLRIAAEVTRGNRSLMNLADGVSERLLAGAAAVVRLADAGFVAPDATDA
jgi:hypothetical protein